MSDLRPDLRLDVAHAIPTAEVVERLGIAGLRRSGAELVGPCPLCGGTDRFGVNLLSGAFLCRRCGIVGGDQVELVRRVLGCGFREALNWLVGAAEVAQDPAELAARRQRAEASARKQAREAERYRQRAIDQARELWRRSRDGRLGVVRAYLIARGLPADLPIPADLRFVLDHPYAKRLERQTVEPHRGPCMVAAIRNAAGEVTAVHQTWVDPAPPHGKARIEWQGEVLGAKLVRGSKKGGAIRLVTPPEARVLVMGEGIETTLAALAADAVPGAAYWAGVDLGNMAGRALPVAGVRHSGLPDLSDREAFVPPEWVRQMIYIQDGDSDPVTTRGKLLCGLRRAMALRPGLRAQIVPAGEGVDLRDVLAAEESPMAEAENADR